MEHRRLGSTGLSVSEVGLGTWEVGHRWGEVGDEEGREAIRTALDEGVTFLDTADAYGDGRSEQQIQRVISEHEADPIVATRVGRRQDEHRADGYTLENLEQWVDRSLRYLGLESLDLLQLHSPPTDVYYQPETFDALAALRDAGKIDHFGVSVLRVEEALKAIEYPGVETVQINFNPFRLRPAELFFEEVARRDIGVIVRIPLASGLLTGTIDEDTEFPETDHRNFNRQGEVFDVGETFSGVPLEVGIAAVDMLRPHVPEDLSLAQFTLRWILDFDAVSTIIPGSTNPDHIRSNIAASDHESLSHQIHGAVRDIYETTVKEHVHHRW